MISGWVYEENLKPLLETVSLFVDYHFGSWNWLAISNGLIETDAEQDQWYEYQLIGSRTVDLKMANDSGSSVVMIQLQSEPKIEEKIQIAAALFQHYRVS